MCFVEVYNEEVFDLLAPTRQALEVREDVPQQRFYVEGASMHVVNSTDAAQTLLQVCTLQQACALSSTNAASSGLHVCQATDSLSWLHCSCWQID